MENYIPIAKIAPLFLSKRLHLTILPTEKCNLRCTYCYEDFNEGKMNYSVITGIKKLIEKRISTIDKLSISWFGGEPLLQKKEISLLSKFALNLCKKNNVSYFSHITTNAVLLTKNTLRSVYLSGITDFQITIDGAREDHDKSRVQANGKGTYDIIIRNIKNALKTDFYISITLRIHYSIFTMNNLDLFISNELRPLLKDPRVNILFHEIKNYNMGESINVVELDSKDRNNIKKTIEKYSDKKNKKDLNVCYASDPNSYVIRSNGVISKCTVALYDDINNIGHITSDGEIKITHEKAVHWLRGVKSGKASHLACPMYG